MRLVTDASRRRVLRAALAPIVGVAVAVVILFIGPNREVVCDEGHLPNRVAQDVTGGLGGGHIDGASASYCPVPANITWVAAGIAFVGLCGAGIVIARQSRTGPPSN
jgi:hypothetical protein